MHSVHNVIMLNKSFNQQTNHRAYVKIKYIILYMNTGVSFMGAGAALARKVRQSAAKINEQAIVSIQNRI